MSPLPHSFIHSFRHAAALHHH